MNSESVDRQVSSMLDSTQFESTVAEFGVLLDSCFSQRGRLGACGKPSTMFTARDDL